MRNEKQVKQESHIEKKKAFVEEKKKFGEEEKKRKRQYREKQKRKKIAREEWGLDKLKSNKFEALHYLTSQFNWFLTRFSYQNLLDSA